jgi:hypothetical protein
VCREYACQAPVADVDGLLAQLSGETAAGAGG